MAAVQSGKQPTNEECDAILTQKDSIFETEDIVLDGRHVKAWVHAPRTFREFFGTQLARFADRPFISSPLPEPSEFYAREQVTYGETYLRALELGAWLREQGVGAEERVAIGGLNSTGWMVAFIAVGLIGAVPVLLNSTLQTEAQIHCLALTKPKLVLVDSHDAAVLGPVAKELRAKKVGRVYCWSTVSHLPREARAGVQDLLGIKPHPASIADVEAGTGLEHLCPESDGVIFFTSGTTSMPKGVLNTQRQALHHIISGSIPAARATLRAGGSLADACAVHNPPAEQLTMLLAVPLFHVTGCLGWMVRAMVLGLKMTFMRRWSVPDAVQLLVDEKISLFGGVPAIATALFQSPDLPKDHVVNGITYGGAPPPERLAKDIAGRWPECFNIHAYGMTETNGIHTGVGGPDYLARPECVGPAQPISKIRVVDPVTGKELPRGQMGVLHCFGSNIMKCYIDNPKATAEALDKDGWLNTGDVAMIDAEGFLYIRDRAKDVIIRGGENIASAEVENEIYKDSRIAEAAAVPVPCERLGERVGVAVSLAPGVDRNTTTAESIIDAVAPRLRHPARPAIIVVLPGAMPRNANGKIVKSDVKQMVGVEWAKQVGGKNEPKARL